MGSIRPAFLSTFLSFYVSRPFAPLFFMFQFSFNPSFPPFCPSRTFFRYVLDCEFNMDHFPSEEVENRTVAFVRQLRAARPTTPIIITEGHPATQRWFFPAIGVTQNSTRAG